MCFKNILVKKNKMSYKIAYNFVKNNDMIFEDVNGTSRKIIIVKELQYTIQGEKYFNFRNEGKIFMDNNCNLSKNYLVTLKELCKVCKLKVNLMKKQDIINQLENYVIFLE
jgi:hypothetical protein